MKGFLRQSMAWLHTWVGLLLGWVLYFMFITGTTGYLDTEIDRWMQPELPVSSTTAPASQVVQSSLKYLQRHAPNAQQWTIFMPLTRNEPYPRVTWSGESGQGLKAKGNQILDAQSGEALLGRATGGGQSLYRMHWKLHYLPKDTGEWIVGVAAMFMFVALISGVIVHRKIFADFFTFRPGQSQRAWLDAHNAASVLTLPFQFMITWSGLIFMMFTYMPLIIAAWYGPGEKNKKLFLDQLSEPPAMVKPSGNRAAMIDLNHILVQAEQHWKGQPVAVISVRHPYDSNSRVVVRSDIAAQPLRAADILVFDGVNGALLAERAALQSPVKGFRDVMLGLHEGLYSGPELRALYVLSGVLGSVMIATGLVLWCVKRRQRIEATRSQPHLGLRVVESLNVATIIGLPIAIAAYFWANRLLPLDMAQRSEWEMHALFITWLALFIHAGLRSPQRTWLEQSALAAIAFGLLPLLNALTTERGLATSLAKNDWIFAGFDLTMLALSAGFAALGWRIYRQHRTKVRTNSNKTNASPVTNQQPEVDAL